MSIRDIIPLVNEILCRGYILGAIIWVTCLMIYIWSLGNKNKAKKNKKKTIIIKIILLYLVLD